MAKKGKPKNDSVFPEVKDNKTKKKGKVTDDDTKSRKKGKSNEENTDDSQKKPQRGLAIGDNFGWTGKLPATLLYEYCQKQKWSKVNFDMKKVSNGFIGIVNLSWENPKTKEIIHIKMIPNSDFYQPKETTNEARHFAATYALHRINYIKNMKMILPKIFRDYWADLEEKRSGLFKSNKEKHDTIYNANPFTVYLEQREKNEQREKERLVREQNEAKVRKPTINIATTNNEKPKRATPRKSEPKISAVSVNKIPSFPKKVWDNAPFMDFPSDVRVSIESAIKKHINWIIENSSVLQESSDSKKYLTTLLDCGFRESHVKESFKYTSTFIDALEWLLFHIPEDDLPLFFAKTEEDSNVSLKISKNIQFEYLVKRVSQSGFDNDEVLTTLKENNNDEIKTCIKLTHKLIDYVPAEKVESSQGLWEEELEGIEVIGSNLIEYIHGSDKKIVMISLNPENITPGLLSLKLFKCDNYPSELPGIQLIVNNPSFKLANYIKLSILRQLLEYIVTNCFIGDCFIYSIVQWLEENISRIIDNPGLLIKSNLLKKSGFSDTKNGTINNKPKSRSINKFKLSVNEIEDLKKSYEARLNISSMKVSLSKRSTLPTWKKKDELVSVINANQVTLVTGETGSGKSTQIVQFILDDLNSHGNFESTIICTQPRRISTIGLAERITEERLDELGKETGYIIRGENKTSKSTRISFVTTGVLLRMLQSFLASGKDSTIFDRLEYIFIDEVHERSVDSDFLLIVLKKIMKKFPNLKIILMSATISIDIFKNFFNTPLNHIHIEGRTYPIKDYYLDSILEDLDYTITTFDDQVIRPKADSHFFKTGNLNYDLIAKLCLHIDQKLFDESNNGSILIFLPGIMEINQCIKYVNNSFQDKGRSSWCLPLHSALSSNDQKKVFRSSPANSRKIVVSTNVAETSITIPDCVVVIDSGRSKTLFYDPKLNTTKLIENWCSKAEIGQRRGRSGRITNGSCFHLYTNETESQMASQPVPEIKRTRLENLYLIVKSMGINSVEDFLNEGLDPPVQTSLFKSKKYLVEIGALNKDKLTHLGKYLSYLPTDLQGGKLLILGCIFGCLDISLTLASIISTGSPFLNNYDQKDKIKQIRSKFSNNQGDLIGMANAFNEYEKLRGEGKSTKQFLSDNYLSYLTLKEISSTRAQYVSILKDIGFVSLGYSSKNIEEFHRLNKNNENYFIVRAILTGSFYPQVARVQLPDPKYFQSSVGAIEIDPDARRTKFWIRNEEYMEKISRNEERNNVLPATRAFIHPASVVFENSAPDTLNNIPNTEDFTKEDGSIDIAKARQLYDFTPQLSNAANSALKSTFIIYGSSHHTTKLYLHDITPTSTLATLLFGGDIAYDITTHLASGKKSPGIILDNWMPIRTWCKNGVLIKRLRILIDRLIEDRLSNPNYSSKHGYNNDILAIVEKILQA